MTRRPIQVCAFHKSKKAPPGGGALLAESASDYFLSAFAFALAFLW